MLLNFGHTLAHTIEQYFHYERESHGEAVAIGMYQLTKMAEEASLSAPGCTEKIKSLLLTYGLPIECGLPMAKLLEAIQLDKKNMNNKLNLILLRDIGDSYIYPASIDFFDTSVTI